LKSSRAAHIFLAGSGSRAAKTRSSEDKREGRQFNCTQNGRQIFLGFQPCTFDFSYLRFWLRVFAPSRLFILVAAERSTAALGSSSSFVATPLLLI
jgi:hypothetical protein